MTKWEYKRVYMYTQESYAKLTKPLPISAMVHTDDRTDFLNSLGEEGWEMVTYDPQSSSVLVVFKRPLATLADNDWIAPT